MEIDFRRRVFSSSSSSSSSSYSFNFFSTSASSGDLLPHFLETNYPGKKVKNSTFGWLRKELASFSSASPGTSLWKTLQAMSRAVRSQSFIPFGLFLLINALLSILVITSITNWTIGEIIFFLICSMTTLLTGSMLIFYGLNADFRSSEVGFFCIWMLCWCSVLINIITIWYIFCWTPDDEEFDHNSRHVSTYTALGFCIFTLINSVMALFIALLVGFKPHIS